MLSSLRRFAVLVCLFYTREWLTCTSAADDAINDLRRYQGLELLFQEDPAVAGLPCTCKHGIHGMYLCEELVPMTLKSSFWKAPLSART